MVLVNYNNPGYIIEKLNILYLSIGLIHIHCQFLTVTSIFFLKGE